MPVIDFDSSKANKITSRFLVYYLEKENQDLDDKDKTAFFDQENDITDTEEIINTIDNNDDRLGKSEDRYYSLYVAPSENELNHIGSDSEKLKNYTRRLMNEYAKNFNKGYTGDDLLYYAKIEQERHYTYKDPQVKMGFVKKGDLKTGKNSHVHIVVSRKTKSTWFKGEKIVDHDGKILVDDPEIIKRSTTAKISPMDTARGTSNFKVGNREGVTRGFDRTNLKMRGEKVFDSMFQYKRPIKEKFEYNNLKKNHPDKFLEKYGKQRLVERVHDPVNITTETQKKRYVLKTIEERLPPNSDKPEEFFNKILNENGIRNTGDSFTFMDSKISHSSVESNLARTANIIFVAYYFADRINKESKGRDKYYDTDKENDNEKNI